MFSSRKSRPSKQSRPNPARKSLGFESLEERRVFARFLYLGTDAGTTATVGVYADADANGAFEKPVQFFNPFGASTAGARVTTGDFDGDGNDELVVAAGPNGHSKVNIYDINGDGTIGSLLDSFSAYSAASKIGLQVATGDINLDGKDELFVATEKGAGRIRTYADTDHDGLLSDNFKDLLLPFGSTYKGGLTIALGDTNNVGRDELIVGQATGGSNVKIFSNSDGDLAFSDETALEEFTAFAAAYKGGVNVAAGQIEAVGSNGAEVMVAGATNAKTVRIFTDSDSDGLVSDGPPAEVINVNPTNIPGGVHLAAGDTDASGSFVELITVSGAGVVPNLRIYDDNNDAGTKLGDNPLDDQFQPFLAEAPTGLFVAMARIDGETVSYSGFPKGIADKSTTIVSLFVGPNAGTITDLDISLQIAHTFIGDLDVTLKHVPTNTSVELFADVGGTCEGAFIRLNDESGTDITTANNATNGPISGSYNPENTNMLSIFDGIDASGEWQLIITDDSNNDVGALYGWQLHFGY